MIEHLLLTLPCTACGNQRIQTIVWHNNRAVLAIVTCGRCDAPEVDPGCTCKQCQP